MQCLGVGESVSEYWKLEREGVLSEFNKMLAIVTGDGSRKRQAGEKPPWWKDNSHEGAIFSHLTKWKRGEKVDKDSGAHPLVHLAWRALAIAYQETHGQVDPVRYGDSDATGHKEDVVLETHHEAYVDGSCCVAHRQERVEGLGVLKNEATPYRVQVYHPSPRVRSLRESGLRG
jgi:hypothetical protein